MPSILLGTYLTLGCSRSFTRATSIRSWVQICSADASRVRAVLDRGCSGGWGHGHRVQLAEDRDIPVYNLANEDDYDMAFEWAWS
jgi:hypothetical protein